MKEKIKKSLSNQWAPALIAPPIIAIITSIGVAVWKKVNIGKSIKIIGNFLKIIFTYKAPVWIMLLSIIAIILILFIIHRFKSLKVTEKEHPDWYYEFRSMQYERWHFKWGYLKNRFIPNMYDNAYTLVDLKPICSCKCDLVSKYPGLMCPNCKKIYPCVSDGVLEEVEHLIAYKINTEYNKNALAK